MTLPTPPAGPWASTTVPFPAHSVPFVKADEYLAPFSWSSWRPGYSTAFIQTVSFRTRKLNNQPAICAWQMWSTDDRFNGTGVRNYQDLEEHVLRLTPGETITSCTVWMNIAPSNVHEACVGRIKLVTDRGQILDTAPNDDTLGTGLSRPVGSGVLCGALGNQSTYATKTLCLLFLASTFPTQTVTVPPIVTDQPTLRPRPTKQPTHNFTELSRRTINWDLVYA